MVRRRKFIHMGRIKINTIKEWVFTSIRARIMAKGYASKRHTTVAMSESRMEILSALKCSGVAMAKMFSNVKAPVLSVKP